MSGAIGGATVVVVGAHVVVVVAFGVAAFDSPPPQAATRTGPATRGDVQSTRAVADRDGVHYISCSARDAVFEGRVGVEQRC